MSENYQESPASIDFGMKNTFSEQVKSQIWKTQVLRITVISKVKVDGKNRKSQEVTTEEVTSNFKISDYYIYQKQKGKVL